MADPPILLVYWRDAHFDFELRSVDDSHPDYIVSTVGFLVHEGPRFVSLAQEILPEGEGYRAVTHIPIALIEERIPVPGWSLPSSSVSVPFARKGATA